MTCSPERSVIAIIGRAEGAATRFLLSSSSFGGITGAHVSVTALWLNVAAMLAANDTVELQGNFTGDDGYFAADHTRFWRFKVS